MIRRWAGPAVLATVLAAGLAMGKPADMAEGHEVPNGGDKAGDAYAAKVEQVRAGKAGGGGDTYQSRDENGDAEPPLTAEDAVLYTDQLPPDWEPYGDNEAVGDLRTKDFDEEYKRYLRELQQEMEENPEVAGEVLQSIDQLEADGHLLSDKDHAAARLAMRFQHKARSKLEEQEREILNRQRRDMKHRQHRKEGLGPEKASQFGFNDPSDPFWHAEKVDKKKLRGIVNKRADLLHNMDRRRRESFLQHEMERLLEYRELVKRTTDPRIKEALIAAHNAENQALKQAHAAEPGKEAALKEEWVDEGFDADTFDPKTLFRMADTNEDDGLDEKEIEAMVHKQAERMHRQEHGQAIDMVAIQEEAARMREHTMEMMDKNNDRIVSYKEFMEAVKSKDFKNDKGWKAVVPEDEIKEKLDDFEKHRADIMRTKHRQADPDVIELAEEAVEFVEERHKEKERRSMMGNKPHSPPKNNPFGKLADKLGGREKGWGKIAEHWGEPDTLKRLKRTAPPSEAARKVKVVKDV